MKLWVLTGDSKETTKNIAITCGLMSNAHSWFEINEKCQVKLFKLGKDQSTKDVHLFVKGATFKNLFESVNSQLRE